MDFNDDDDNNEIYDDFDRKQRTLWVGNLHPKVSYDIVAELFYQVKSKQIFYSYVVLLIVLLM